MGWTLVCLVSLLVLYYQWENWRGARELKAARARLIERVGTDDPVAFAAPTVPDEQNFFALPVIEKWATQPLEHGSAFKAYDIPKHVFVPANFTQPELVESGEEGLPEVVDWSAWARARDLQGEAAAVVMNRELGDANGLLPQLAAGLTRPFACLKPGVREAFEARQGRALMIDIPKVQGLLDSSRDLALHLRAAAHAGDAAKTQTSALIALRLFPESCATHGVLISALQSFATHGIVFDALHDALSCPAWDERSLSLLQAQLAKDNDVHTFNRALISETLWVHAQLAVSRRQSAAFQSDGMLEFFENSDGITLAQRLDRWVRRLGPIGWHDADNAAYLTNMLDTLGPDSDTAWIGGDERSRMIGKNAHYDRSPPWWSLLSNPRRWIACMGYPNWGNVCSAAAERLFRRRCLIIACALEKHRIKHGRFPVSLNEMEDGLKLFAVADPARPAQLPGYRLEPGGYLLWSAGPDAQDDGGVKDKDWLWRMKLTPQL